jgi:NTP pyrophosphatase (non-canonical NTP hydrolase)
MCEHNRQMTICGECFPEPPPPAAHPPEGSQPERDAYEASQRQHVRDGSWEPPTPPPGPGQPLQFDRLRAVNVARCINGFGHTLDSWSPAEWTNAMCGEAGEAANVAKKMLRHRDNVAGNKGEDRDLSALREKLARELADVVIYADLCAAAQGIDLAEAVRETFNRKSEEIGAEHKL